MASAPVFRKPLHDLSTTQGECLVLECRVSGTPLPDIIWRREGHVITDSPDFRMLHKDEVATLVINEAFPEDSGIFSCEASNKTGIATTSCKIVVKGVGSGCYSSSTNAPLPASLNKIPHSVLQKKEEINTISLMASSSASSNTSSSRNKTHISSCHIVPIKPNRHASLRALQQPESTSSISVSRTNQSSVTSSCRLSNFSRLSYRERSLPNAKHNFIARQSVNDRRRVVVKPTPNRQEGRRRGDFVLYSPTVGITENQPQEYKVSSFEQRLINEIEYRLERIPPINEDPEDAVFEDVPVAQQTNPIFVSTLKNFKTGKGSPCTFSCRISAKPKAKVYWFKDGRQISKRSKNYLQKSNAKGDYELHIPHPSMDDDGNYTAVACNPQGRVSSTGRLAVFYDKSSSYRDGFTSPTNVVMLASFSSKGELIAGHEENTMEGYYKPCFIQKPPPDTTAEEGKLVRFDVKVSGLPVPDLVWLINGKPVTQDALHKIVVRENNVHSFLLERVSPMDEGQYTIKALNKAGFAVTHCQLHVKPREHMMTPAFIQRLVGQCVAEGNSVRLEARVVGTPYPKICWKKGSDQVLPDRRTHLFEGDNGYVCLQLTETQLNDAGWYSCNAANVAGISSCNCKLDVYNPVPSAPATQRVRIRTPHRYENLARVTGIDVRESFSPEASIHNQLIESEEL